MGCSEFGVLKIAGVWGGGEASGGIRPITDWPGDRRGRLFPVRWPWGWSGLQVDDWTLSDFRWAMGGFHGPGKGWCTPPQPGQSMIGQIPPAATGGRRLKIWWWLRFNSVTSLSIYSHPTSDERAWPGPGSRWRKRAEPFR